jgi:UDPglucose 6-dehydrogenase
MLPIAVIGIGYVGLVTAACFAKVGHRVINLDIDPKKVAQLRQGCIPIFEPGLESIVKETSSDGRLSFTTEYETTVPGTKIVVLAVDTPTGPDGRCNTHRIEQAALSVADAMTEDLFVVIKSTVPVGTSARIESLMRQRLHERGVPFSVELISNPEFLREGLAINDFMKPDRVVVGVSSERAEEVMRELYQPFQHTLEKFIVMDTRSSELTKYASNAMLACRISYMNWLSRLCEENGADIEQVRIGMGADTRIGPAFLRPGIGFGGSCFPKDIRALKGMADELELPCNLIAAIDTTNEEQKVRLSQKIIEHFSQQHVTDPVIAIFGLAFKPDTDDMREAPSIPLIKQLIGGGMTVRLFDPVAMENAKKLLPPSPQIIWCRDEWEAATGADAVAFATEWSCFVNVDFQRLRQCMRGTILFDGRNMFSPDHVCRQGFSYVSIGRQPVYVQSAVEFSCH